jgi:MFS family permease
VSPDASPPIQEAEQPGTRAIRAVVPTVLPAPVRRRMFFFLGVLVVLVNIGSPSHGLFETALSLLLKNKLQLSASQVSDFRALVALPIYLSAVFGFIRDRWNPFGMGDRGLILLFGNLTAALYSLLAFVPVTYTTLLVAILLLRVSFRLVSSAESGLLGTLAQQHTMSGQISALWTVVLSLIGVAGVLLGGRLSDRLEVEGSDRAFHVLFLVCAAVVAGVVLYGWWRPSIVFDNVRPERREHNRPIDDIRRLATYWPLYPALLITLLWNFAPGTDTALLYYLQRTFHATDTQWGEWNGIFSASFIPTFAVFGVLCTSIPLNKLLVWGTVIGVPQMIPLLFIHSVNDALLAAVAMGLMGGIASAAYIALVIRSCPPGLQGTILMMSAALQVTVARLGDILGTRLYDNFGGFQSCVIAITIVYALILPTLLLVPRNLISTADGEVTDLGYGL